MFIFRKARSEKRKASCKKWPHSNRKTVVTPSSQVVHTKEKYHFVTSKYQAVSWNFMKSDLIVFKELILRNKRLKSLRFPSTWILIQKSRKNSLFQVTLIITAGDKFHKNLNNPKILNLLLQCVSFQKSKEEKARTNNQTRVETFAVFPLANCRRMLPIFPRTEFIGVRC